MTVKNPFVLFITSGLLLLSISHVDARSDKSRVIGIHLGNLYSSVSVYKHPEAEHGASTFYKTMEAVANEHGSIATPSCVSFTDSGVLVGEAAKAQEALHPQRTVCGIVRLLGRRFDDPELQSFIKTLPYKVVEKDDKPYAEVELNGGEIQLFSPEEICGIILRKMKEMAEKYMGAEFSLASVLVHGSYWVGNKGIRKGISGAGKIAGINLPYGCHSLCGTELVVSRAKPDDKALIIHLGGSAFMASIVKLDRTLEETGTRKDINFGGQMFDTRLVDYFVELIKNKYDKDISNDSKALRELRVECERAKISLSETDRVMVNAEFRLADGQVLVIEEALTREKFEELNMDLFERTVDMVKSVFEEARFNTSAIDEIVLLGRSTQIPMIRRLIKRYVGKKPQSYVKPKDAFLFTATAHVGLVARYVFDIPDRYKVPLNPVSVGIEDIGAVMVQFFMLESVALPASRTRNVKTVYDGQTTMVIKVFEGERVLTKYCRFLGNLQLSNLPPAPRGETKVEVTVDEHVYGEIVVTAEHKPTQNEQRITIPKEERSFNALTQKQLIQEFQQVMENRDRDRKAMLNIYRFYHLYPPQPRIMGFAVSNY